MNPQKNHQFSDKLLSDIDKVMVNLWPASNLILICHFLVFVLQKFNRFTGRLQLLDI